MEGESGGLRGGESCECSASGGEEEAEEERRGAVTQDGSHQTFWRDRVTSHPVV
jgi:hypothetical protein